MEDIVKWLKSQKITLEAESCLEESLLCYKAGAYKASLLFAYLGFMTILRNRILTANSPTGFPQQRWEYYQRSIQIEETWDKVVFDMTQQKSPSEIFLISDNLRGQIKYWKDRRNDCAHSKDNLITAAYVETLYSFIHSNINKLVVNGNKNSVMQRIIDHFDPSLTPPTQSIEPIIKDMPHAVSSNQLGTFLSEIFAYFDSSRNSTQIQLRAQSANKLKFLNACFQFGSNQLKEECKNLLIVNDELSYEFLRIYPDKCSFLNGSPDRVRRLWHDYLFKSPFRNDFQLLATLLRNNLIPDSELNEMFDCVLQAGTQETPNDIDDVIFKAKGFYASLERVTMDKISNFDWANNTRNIIIKYLTEYPITTEMAQKIFNNCSGTYHPWHLAEDLNEFFRINPAKKQEYLDITVAHPEIGIPNNITSLN